MDHNPLVSLSEKGCSSKTPAAARERSFSRRPACKLPARPNHTDNVAASWVFVWVHYYGILFVSENKRKRKTASSVLGNLWNLSPFPSHFSFLFRWCWGKDWKGETTVDVHTLGAGACPLPGLLAKLPPPSPKKKEKRPAPWLCILRSQPRAGLESSRKALIASPLPQSLGWKDSPPPLATCQWRLALSSNQMPFSECTRNPHIGKQCCNFQVRSLDRCILCLPAVGIAGRVSGGVPLPSVVQ